jgi:ribosomal protein S18 acetylase RimI-like enzyme
MEIREIAPGEYAELGALTLVAYKSAPGSAVTRPYEDELLDVEGRARGALVLVAIDGRLLGGVTYVGDVTNAYAEFDDPQAAGIRMLAVDPEAQGRGIGMALVEACLDQARADGRARVVLHSTPWMRAAHRLYDRLGFVRRPDLDWQPVPDVYLAGYVFELGGEP